MNRKIRAIIAVAVALAGSLALTLLLGIKVPLGVFEHQIEKVTGAILNRHVDIAGDIRVLLSINPKLEIGNLSIANPEGWDDAQPMLKIKEATAQIALLPLVQGKISIRLIELLGIDLTLTTRSDLSTNYALGKHPEKDNKGLHDTSPPFFTLSSVDELKLNGIHLTYDDELTGKKYGFDIASAYGSARVNEKLSFKLNGTFAELPITLDISGDQLQGLVQLADLWSLTSGQLKVGNAVVSLTGAVGRDNNTMSGYLDVSIMGNDLLHLGQQFDIVLPETDVFSMAGRLSLVPGAVTASNIFLQVGQGEITSDLRVSLDGVRPTVMGNVKLAHFDSSAFSFPRGDNTDYDGKREASNIQNVFAQSIPYHFLEYVDADLHIHGSDNTIDRYEVTNTDIIFSLVDGDLLLPLATDVMGINIHSQLEINGGAERPYITVQGTVEKENLNRLLAAIGGDQTLTGNLGKLEFAIESSGTSPKDLLENLLTDINLDGVHIVSKRAGQIFSADKLAVTRTQGAPLTISGNGRLLGKPFSAAMVFGALPNEADKQAHGFHVDLKACDSTVKLAYLDGVGDKPASMDFSLRGQNVCGMLQPVEQFLQGNSDFALEGSALFDSNRWELTFDTIHFADFRGRGATAFQVADNGVPLLSVDLHSQRVDIRKFLQKNAAENSSLSEPAGTIKNGGTAETPDATEAKALAQKIISLLTREIPAVEILEKADIDLVFKLDELLLQHDSFTDFRFETHARDGNIVSSPFSMNIAGSQVSGDVKLDLKSNTPVCIFNFSLSDAGLPKIFSSFGMPDAPGIEAENISATVRLEGKTLLDMIKSNSLEVSLQNGAWRIGANSSEAPVMAKIDSLMYRSKVDTPATLAIVGSFQGEPVTIDMVEDGLFAKRTGKPIDLTVDVSAGDAKAHIRGTVKRHPGSKSTFHLDTKIAGTRLDKLNNLLHYNLPPFGPYEFHGAVHTEENAVIVDNLITKIKNSVLSGEASLRIRKDENGNLINPSHLESTFKAKTLQLNDFPLEGWSATRTPPEVTTAATETPAQTTEGIADLFGQEFAELLEVHLEVIVEEVLSGTDHLGSGYLAANNSGGKNTVESLRLEIPGGQIEAEGSYLSDSANAEADLHLEMEHFDYGILVRRAVPESEVKGLMNIKIDLSSRADTPARLKDHVNGKLRIGVIPEDLESGIVDLWAVNILSAALPAIMKGSESEVNCLAGDFTFNDGVITPEVFLLDTSRMRVQGEGSINLKDEKIDFNMRPTPKSPQFLSLATPVNITGTIRDYHIGVSAGSVIGTVFRLVSGVITVPLQKLFGEDMEADGVKACSAAMSWVIEPMAQSQY